MGSVFAGGVTQDNQEELVITDKEIGRKKDKKERPYSADRQNKRARTADRADGRYNKEKYKHYIMTGASTTCDLPWGPTDIHNDIDQVTPSK